MSKKNENNVRNIVVLNTKGGVGKSIFTTQIAPMFTYNGTSKINIYQIDDNNTIVLKSDFINLFDIKINKFEDVIDEIELDKFQNNDVINIVDCGGGSDTKIILEYLKKSDFKNIEYYIPTNEDIEQVHNVNKTIELIRNFDKKAEITLVLNKVKNIDEVEEQFFAFFDKDDIYELDHKLKYEDINEFKFMLDTKVLGLIKNKEKTTLLDFFFKNEEIIAKVDELKNKVANDKSKTQEEIKIEFKRLKQQISNTKDAVQVAEYIKKNFS